MNIHAALQIVGTAFIAWNIYDSWAMLWSTPTQLKKLLRFACLRLCLWSAAGGLALGYWLDVLFS